ncbi:MAG TPA: type II secretion system protein [Mollicutes bacterium]|nr:type II secretion system protein [Mollicutes bacterium]
MNKKGFTLIEVLSVIIILGVLSVITVPMIIGNIEETKKVAYEQLLENIEQTTQLYIRKNKDSIEGIKTVNNEVTISLQDLVDKEGLKTPVIDPKTEKEISLTTTVLILVKPKGKYEVTVGPFIYEE